MSGRNESDYPSCDRPDRLNEMHHGQGEDHLRAAKGREPGCARPKKGKMLPAEADGVLDINNKLIIYLRNLGYVMRFLYEGRESQKRALMILRDAGTMTQRELTEQMGVKPGSASEVLGKLENAGLIQRKLSETDRRTADIQLTEAGLAQVEETAKQHKMRHQEMFSCLSEEEKSTLLALLERLNTDWNSRYRKRECASEERKKPRSSDASQPADPPHY